MDILFLVPSEVLTQQEQICKANNPGSQSNLLQRQQIPWCEKAAAIFLQRQEGKEITASASECPSDNLNRTVPSTGSTFAQVKNE